MLTWLSLAFLLSFFNLATIDGIYFHLIKFRLFLRPESRAEHALHTVRALLAVPTLWLLYLAPPTYLWALLGVIGLDQLVASADMSIEKRSRLSLGGLPHSEYMVHVSATAMHSMGLTLGVVARFVQLGGAMPPPAEAYVKLAALGFVLGAGLVAVLHVALLLPGVGRLAESSLRAQSTR